MASKIKIDFVKQNWPLAQAASLKYGINPVAILANRVKETGWQGHKAAHQRKNYFGITATKNSATTPHWFGKSSKGGGGLLFRIYSAVQENFFDYAWIIKTRYPQAAAAGADLKAFADAIAKKYTGSRNGGEVEAYKLLIQGFGKEITSIAQSLGYLPA